MENIYENIPNQEEMIKEFKELLDDLLKEQQERDKQQRKKFVKKKRGD